MAYLFKEAIILAGGLGTRLRSAVPDLPKCMAPVAGKPFLSYVIDYYLAQGVESFIFSLGYLHEIIEEYLHQQYPNLAVQFSVETDPLGTGGAIKLACTYSRSADKTVLVLNGDTLFKINAGKLAAFHHKCDANCTLTLKPMKNFDRYGVVELNADDSVKSFREKQFYAEGLINGGVYALHVERFLAEDLPQAFSFEKDYLEKMVGKRRIYGVAQDGYFIDIGIPEDYQRAQNDFIIK